VVALLAVVLALALLPAFVRKPYVLHMGVILFLAILQGQAWNIVGGYAGQYSVGHAAYFGVGAYATVMLLEQGGVAPWWGLGAAMAVAVVLSLVIGSVTFRLRGPYFVLASISVAEIIRLAALHFRGFTRGAEGFVVSGVPALNLFGAEITFLSKRPFYFVTLALAVLSVAVSWSVRRSKLGYYLLAIREDQDAAHSLGINLSLYKNVALAISAALTGLAGGVYAVFTRFIDPNIAFSLSDVSIQIVLICIIGGIGTIVGPVIGAFVLVPLSEVLRNPRGLVQVGLLSSGSPAIEFIEQHLSNAHQLVYGVLVVLVILFAPDGVLGVLRRIAARFHRTLQRPAAAAGAPDA
jgi:branched-chain amino acid transport system permease protein